MKRYDLGKQLKERELRLGRIPAQLVEVVPIDEIVESFFECAKCGKKFVYDEVALKMIDDSNDAEEFIEQINIAFKWHNGVLHGE